MRIVSQRKTQPSHLYWMSLGFKEGCWTPLKIHIIPISLDLYTEMPGLRTSHFPLLQLMKHCHGCNRRNNSWLTLIQQISQTNSDRGIGLPLRRLRWVSSKRNHWNRILSHCDQIQWLLSMYVQAIAVYNLIILMFSRAGLNWQIHLIRTIYAWNFKAFISSPTALSMASQNLQGNSSMISLPLPLIWISQPKYRYSTVARACSRSG